jgi:hypothetical protein
MAMRSSLGDLNGDTGGSTRATSILSPDFAQCAILRFRPSERSRDTSKSKNNDGEYEEDVHVLSIRGDKSPRFVTKSSLLARLVGF